MKDRRAEFRSTSPSGVRPSCVDLVRLVRAPAASSVPGDVLAGAAAAGRPWNARTLGTTASAVCLYWAGMALNDYADATIDAVERPDRPIPSGRVPRRTALAVACGLTAAGLGLATAAGGRRGLLGALPLAGLVWAYDLGLKNTPAGASAMAGARAVNVLTGALSTAPTAGAALRAGAVPAALIGAHTYTLMALSRHETTGAPARVPATTLAGATATALATASGPVVGAVRALRDSRAVAVRAVSVGRAVAPPTGDSPAATTAGRVVRAARGSRSKAVALLAAGGALAYLGSYGVAQLRAVREPSADNVRQAVGAGILALMPLQAALTARAGAPAAAALLGVAHPLARRLARRISPT